MHANYFQNITGDYDTVFASMRSERIPDVDFTSLFLKASRRGQRDLALLLSTHVPDLLKKDEWGDNALTIAAKLVIFSKL